MVNWLNIYSPNNDKLIVSILVDKYLVDFGFIKNKFTFGITSSEGMKNTVLGSPVFLYSLDGCNGILCIDNDSIYLYSKNSDGTLTNCANVKYLREHRYDFGKFESLIEDVILSNYNVNNSLKRCS